MKPRIVIRADGGSTIGMGHVVRCLALADMLKQEFDIAFAIQETDDSILTIIRETTSSIIKLPQTKDYLKDVFSFSNVLAADDIVVLDGYHFKTEYQEKIKSIGCKLVCIDDLHDWHHVADVIINHADSIAQSAYSAEPYTKFCLGLAYLLLRSAFLTNESAPRKINKINRVFISMGAADGNNLSQLFTQALLEIEGIKEIHLMLGSINPHLKVIEKLMHSSQQVKIKTHFNISATELIQLLNKCDVAICPASSISLECCAVGIGLISGYTAENQKGILKSLIRHKAVIDFGNLNQLNIVIIKNNIEKITSQPELLNKLVVNQNKMIDGKSPERLLEVFRKLTDKKLYFRFATAQDAELYFNWTNDEIVRANSFNQELVAYNDHVKWFQSKLSSPDCRLYLFLNRDGTPVGQVRIDKNPNETVISISIDKKFRGQSFGTEMLKSATMAYLKENAGAIIFAYIKKENIASYKTFSNAGFITNEIVSVDGVNSFKLQKTLK